MSKPKDEKPRELWPAYGPEKEAWKKAGNCYTADELRQMAIDLKDFAFSPRTRRVYVVD